MSPCSTKKIHNKEFLERVRVELEHSNDNNPIDHSLEAVLPGVHTRLAAQTNEITTMRTQLNQLQQNQETCRSEQQDFQTEMLDLIR